MPQQPARRKKPLRTVPSSDTMAAVANGVALAATLSMAALGLHLQVHGQGPDAPKFTGNLQPTIDANGRIPHLHLLCTGWSMDLFDRLRDNLLQVPLIATQYRVLIILLPEPHLCLITPEDDDDRPTHPGPSLN